MPKIDQLIEDIRELKAEVNRRSAHRIFSMLENHQREFAERIDPEYLAMALKNFGSLSESSPGQAATAEFKREFEKSYEGLLFQLNRIL